MFMLKKTHDKIMAGYIESYDARLEKTNELWEKLVNQLRGQNAILESQVDQLSCYLKEAKRRGPGGKFISNAEIEARFNGS